jgi:transcriptional regulator with XRE-family HTH domain
MFDLKAFRAEQNLTQQELAELWGLRPEMISRWENGDMPAIAEYAARALKADLHSQPLQAKAPVTAKPKPKGGLGRPAEALVQGITNV